MVVIDPKGAAVDATNTLPCACPPAKPCPDAQAAAPNASHPVGDTVRVLSLVYPEVELWTRLVFYRRGLQYDESRIYYNDVFEHVYTKVLEPTALSRRLNRFDPARGTLLGFFRVVVQNTVRDWLRVNEIKVSIHGKARDGEIPSRAPDSAASDSVKPPIDRDVRLPWCEANGDEREDETFLDMIPQIFRVMLKLRYIAYFDLDEDDLQFIAQESRRSPTEVRDLVVAAKRDIVNSEAYRKQEIAAQLIPVLEIRLARQTREVAEVKRRLEVLGVPEVDLERTEKTARSQTMNALIAVDKNLPAERHSGGNYAAEAMRREYMKSVKVADNLEKRLNRRRELQNRLLGWKHGEMADLLKVEQGAVGSRLSRAKGEIGKCRKKLLDKGVVLGGGFFGR